MATAPKIVKMRPVIDPDLKAFLDEVLVPMLVRDALKDIAEQEKIAERMQEMAHSASETRFREETDRP
jgi:hypothetical protein